MNLLEILATHVQHRFVQVEDYYLMVEDRDIHNFTLTGNRIQVKALCGDSKQQVPQRNNTAIRPDITFILK